MLNAYAALGPQLPGAVALRRDLVIKYVIWINFQSGVARLMGTRWSHELPYLYTVCFMEFFNESRNDYDIIS